MREICFYRTASGDCPVEGCLAGLGPRQAQKVAWVLRVVRELPIVPPQYFQKLEGTAAIWEIRADFCRGCVPPAGILGRGQPHHPDERLRQEDAENTGARARACRTAKTSPLEPEENAMKDDWDRFIERRKRTDREFAKDFEAGFQEFKVGVLLRPAREQAGVSQETLARRTRTQKSAISRLENHAEDVRLSTLERVARTLGKTLRIELVKTRQLRAGGAAERRADDRAFRSGPSKVRTDCFLVFDPGPAARGLSGVDGSPPPNAPEQPVPPGRTG